MKIVRSLFFMLSLLGPRQYGRTFHCALCMTRRLSRLILGGLPKGSSILKLSFKKSSQTLPNVRGEVKKTPSGQTPFLCPPRNWYLVHPGPLSENFIFSPRVTSFFDFYNVLLALIIPYFAFILPFYFPFSLFLSPFFLFLVHFPLSSLPLLIFFFPK
jgi:hypothetical protein